MVIIVKNFCLTASLVFIVTQLVGCAGNVRPESEPPPVVEKSEPVAKPEDKLPEKPVEHVVQPPVVPRTQAPAPVVRNNATTSLVNQARTQYQAKNYQGAIAIAERALRIDRRSPEVYLILAQSYLKLANTQLALQFAQQGIRYSQAGTDLAKTLTQVRDSIQK